MLCWRKRNSRAQLLAGNDEGEIMTCIKSSSFWNPLFVWWIRFCFSWLPPLHLRGHAMWLNTPRICVFFSCIYLELQDKIQCHSAQCSPNSFLSFFLYLSVNGLFSYVSQQRVFSLLFLARNVFWAFRLQGSLKLMLSEISSSGAGCRDRVLFSRWQAWSQLW